ncbi:MAG: hypothetical protein CMJ08_06140 [Pelagibacterales bacterium]|nr:hypothetical protein [Pelagibacterales bacterium]|tara:strand:- start:171 stop:782 length:612 start_codon:yes stop_codon:yes gene_type:complete
MSYIKNFFLIIFNLIVFYNFSFSQESYLIKKNKTKDTSITSSDNKKNKASNEDLKKKEKINKKDKAKEGAIKKEKNVVKNKDSTINKIAEEIDKGSENSIIFKDNKFRIIYKPNKIKLSQKDVIKIIEISSNFNKENILTIKSYASQSNKGSSEARRTSLSRALEIRSLFVENEFPATNILVRALGTEENDEGFTDVIIIEVN